MTKNYLIVLILAVLALPLGLRAEVMDGLYSALIPVQNHSDTERNRGLKQGLLQVLVRLSGDSTIGERPEVQALLPKAAQYTVSYSYRATPESDVPQALQVTYANNEIDRFLRVNQLPVWPARRPNLLLWLVAETPEAGKHFLTVEEEPELFDGLGKLFSDRGLPVRYPLLDLEDQLSLSAEDAWTLNPEAIASASQRYQVPAWLVVRAYQTSGLDWQLAWVLFNDQHLTFDDTLGENLMDALQPIGNRAVDIIAGTYSYIPSLAEGQIAVNVSGVGSFSDYSDLMGLFDGLSMIRDVSLQHIRGDQVSMILRLEGDEKPLLESLALSNRFLMPEDVAVGQQLSLVWAPR